ncbi:MAG: integration host factor subunit beta [Legionellales bacterium RIFCSPHIGHO2_12_FULL_35_11]|nr:MAG: integration host factor subunit beta [Legionellales bacterium RIFCSPHIGHO2_12_FULL_35_11]
MIKSEFIANISNKVTNLPEKTITDSINKLLSLMSDVLARNERIEIRGFGSFSLHYHPQRNAHNPKTGEKVLTADKYSPHFKPGKELRERIDSFKENYPIEDDE